MNNVLETNFFSRLGLLISRPKSRFSIEQKHNLDIQFTADTAEEIVAKVARADAYQTSERSSKFATNPLPLGILDLPVFKAIVESEAKLSNSSFLLEMSLNQSNCAFLTDSDRKDLAIDCLKEVLKSGLGENAFTFGPSQKIWLLFTNVSPDSAINKANLAFRRAQKLVREELDFHESLVELNMYKIQDCIPDIF